MKRVVLAFVITFCFIPSLAQVTYYENYWSKAGFYSIYFLSKGNPPTSIESYSADSPWGTDKEKLDTLFSKTLYLDGFNPKYLGTVVLDQDTFEEISAYEVTFNARKTFIYTNNHKRSIVVSYRNLVTHNYIKYDDMSANYCPITYSLYRTMGVGYRLIRMENWIKN